MLQGEDQGVEVVVIAQVGANRKEACLQCIIDWAIVVFLACVAKKATFQAALQTKHRYSHPPLKLASKILWRIKVNSNSSLHIPRLSSMQ